MKREIPLRSLTPDLLVTGGGSVGTALAPPSYASIGAPPPQQNMMTPKFALNVLRRWWKLSILAGVVLAAATAVISYLTYQPRYEATTWLRIRPQYIITKGDFDLGSFVSTQRELVRSPPILTEALAKPGIASLQIFEGIDDPIMWLNKELLAQSVGGSQLFVIKLQSSYRDCVAKVVNAIRDAYLANLTTDIMRQNDTLLITLEQERQRRSTEIENDRMRLKSLMQEAARGAGYVDFDESKFKTLLPSLPIVADLQKQLASQEVDILFKEASNKVLERSVQDADVRVDTEAARQALDGHPEVLKLLADYERKSEELAGIESLLSKTSTSPKLREKREAVKKIEADLANKRRELKPKVEEELVNVHREKNKMTLEMAKKQLDEMQTMKSALTERLNKAREEAQKIGGNALSIKFLAEDLVRKEKVYNSIVDRIEVIKTESRVQAPVTTLMDAAEPVEPIDSGPIKRAAMFALLALLIPFVGFFLWELKSRRISDVDDFRTSANLRVVGEISTLPVRSKFLPGAHRKFEESLTRFEESIDYLRTTILIARHQRTMQSLVVTSAASREGKSTVAAHLASSLARGISGRVLLVDADMRRPHLHRLLDQDPEHGLVDYLSGRSEFADVVRSTWVDRLDFVASGVLDTPVGVLLANDRFERFLRQAERQYEFIVIDVPPILPVSEGLVIAKAADGAIYCALRDVSTMANVQRACEKLRGAGVHIVGAVFNGVPAREYGASGYYYYRIPQPTGSTETITTSG